MEEKKYNRKLYNKQYYERHKEEFKIRKNKWLEQHPNYKKEYYQKNKEILADKQREYQAKNRERITKYILKRRKEIGIELSKQGQMYVYHSRGVREKKMCEKISKVYNISLEDARNFLAENNWNCKKLLSNHNSKKEKK